MTGYDSKRAAAAGKLQEPHEYDWSMLKAAQESLREHMARIKELEAQLAQPAQEPVALDVTIEGDAAKLLAVMLEPVLDEPTPIRLLVGNGYSGYGLYVAASEYQNEGAVFLVNTAPPAAQPAQEPVAWRTFDGEGQYEYRAYEENESYADDWNKRNPNHKGWVEPLYTHPPQHTWVGLTDEEIDAIYWQHENHGGEYKVSIWPYERAIEAKLKEKNT